MFPFRSILFSHDGTMLTPVPGEAVPPPAKPRPLQRGDQTSRPLVLCPVQPPLLRLLCPAHSGLQLSAIPRLHSQDRGRTRPRGQEAWSPPATHSSASQLSSIQQFPSLSRYCTLNANGQNCLDLVPQSRALTHPAADVVCTFKFTVYSPINFQY